MQPEKPSLPDLSLAMLEKVFPRTFLCLRESERGKLAKEFARTGTARDLQRFPELLTDSKWGRVRGFLADLAKLEYSLRIATLAPDLERRGFEGVTTASEPEWYQARFRFDPAHKILESDWPLDRIYPYPQGEHVPEPCTFLIYRTEGKATFRRLGQNESLLIRSLDLGVPLGRILERNGGPDFDAFLFHQWIESGLLRAIDWAPV